MGDALGVALGGRYGLAGLEGVGGVVGAQALAGLGVPQARAADRPPALFAVLDGRAGGVAVATGGRAYDRTR
jgi:hypothetical protein